MGNLRTQGRSEKRRLSFKPKRTIRSETRLMLTKLDEAGVTVIATRYVGEIHDFGILNGARNVPATQEAIRQASDVLKEYLNQ